jgi:hypothetical protein
MMVVPSQQRARSNEREVCLRKSDEVMPICTTNKHACRAVLCGAPTHRRGQRVRSADCS